MKRLVTILAVMALSASSWGITGRLQDDKGRPVVNAKVAVWTFWTTDRAFRTDADGRFVYLRNVLADFTHLVTGVVTSADGRPLAKATVTVPWDNEAPTMLFTNQKGVFSYQPANDSKGLVRILDAGGRPAAGAKVVLSSEDGGWKKECVTDEKGESKYRDIEVVGEDQKELLFLAAAKGYTYASTYYHLGQAKPLVIKAWPERVLKAKIVGEDGSPLPGATVVLDNIRARLGDGDLNLSPQLEFPVKVITGKDGQFVLSHLPGIGFEKSAFIALTVGAPGRARIDRREYPLADLRKQGRIVLPRECVLQGVVHLPGKDMSIPEGLLLQAKLREKYGPAGESEYWTGVDRDGKFRFAKMPPGKATISLGRPHRVSMGWVLPAIHDVEIAPGQVKNVELEAVAGAVVSGCIRDKATGNPVSAVLSVEHEGNPVGDHIATDSEGRYEIRVPGGKVRVYVSFVFIGDGRADYDSKDRPFRSLEVSNGDDKPGQDMLIDLPAK